MKCNSFKQLFVTIITALSIILFTSNAVADGPVPPSSLPGGATFTDSDPGNGESWGRVGGRNWTFSNFDFSKFNKLSWGPVDNTSVGIAFDGTINAGTGEELNLTPITASQAIWVGSTQVDLYPGPVTSNVQTRFVLTIVSSFSPVSFQANPISGLPSIDAMASGGQFTVNLSMQAKMTESDPWEPALDLFDRLSTDPNGAGLAQTSFRSGFFFELAGVGLSLEEHDANMVSKTSALANDIDFLKGETVGRLSQLLDDNQLLEQLVRNIPTEHPPGGGGASADEVGSIVSEKMQGLINILTFLWGVPPGEEPDPSTITLISQLATQTSLDSTNALISDIQLRLAGIESALANQKDPTNLEIEVIGIGKGHKHKKRLIVLSKEGGEQVDVGIVSVQAIVRNHNKTTSVVNVSFSVNNLTTGLAEVSLNAPESLKNAKSFNIKAKHVHGDGSVHYQSTIFSTKGGH